MKNLASILILVIALVSCKSENKKSKELSSNIEQANNDSTILREKPEDIVEPTGMRWASGVDFTMGAPTSDPLALPRERPAHPVAVDGFFIDITEVTNKEFREFVEETGYVTVAERPIDWDELKKQLPPNTPKPHDSLLQPGSQGYKVYLVLRD